MNASTGRLWGAVLALSALTLTSAAPAAAQTVPSNLRVVASGQELANVRQYVGKTVIPTSPAADCFGPGNQGSGNKASQVGPDALSVLVEAASVKDRLSPVLVTDAFVDDGFGLGLCSVGGYTPPPDGFWYLKINHRNPNLGASLVTVGPDTETLWYLTPSFPPGNELAIDAPARVLPGTPVPIQVIAYADDGTTSAATGASVTGAGSPAVVDSSGGTSVTFPQPGQYELSATRSGDIPSQSLPVCVANPLTQCPETRGQEILGTDGPDNIVGTLGPDQIRPRASNDNIKGRAGDDLIVSRGGGADRVKCGGGTDVVMADKKDRFGKSCETVKGGHAAKTKGKKNR